MNEEKRNSKRIATKVMVNCMKNSEEQYKPDYFISFTKDLSYEGARIVSPKDIKPRDQFTVSLQLPTLFIPILTFSEAVWVKKLRGPEDKDVREISEVGIRFLKIEEPDIEKLKKFLEFKETNPIK